ncbi:uncharacterized protein LOC106632099 [Geospiza fortis]|uniref:Uncharacterized protein LOC106632099 n=1 Tax=Geospiza fortis TaxID=48883 RepID=A0A8N5F4N2_GEOFO|nr:uncharacterized protein LOC106632099 [Geospiza fortis]
MGSPECQNQTVTHAVTAGGSLCLAPEKPPREWTEMHWVVEINSAERQRILTVTRDGTVSYPRGPFNGRAKFQRGNLSLCISPVHRDDDGVYGVDMEILGVISAQCFRVSVWGEYPFPGDFSRWTLLAVAVAVGLSLLLMAFCCWRKRRENSREGTPGTPPEQALTVYAEVGEKKPSQEPARTGEAAQEGATIYAVVTPRTWERPRRQEEPGNFTIYSTVQFDRRPSSIKRKRLNPSLVSTAYLEDNGGYRRLGSPNPAGRQRP